MIESRPPLADTFVFIKVARPVAAFAARLTAMIMAQATNRNFAQTIDFSKNGGVVPVVVQEHSSGRVLMLAYMNRAAFEETVATQRACYFSRSRNALWRKGEESGNYQVVREIRIDCDQDTILLSVEQRGDGVACHEGYQSCFFRMLRDGEWQTVEPRKIDPAKYGPGYGHNRGGQRRA